MPILGCETRADYQILISRGWTRPRVELLPFSVRDAIPRFALPLLDSEEAPEIDLGSLLGKLYDVAGYDLSIDYREDPIPPLRPADAAWADGLLRACGLRAG